ncbi:MAG: LuxR C-terminal-related transcriptional regulator [Bacteroidales bacterium]|jgi:DNA-binding NarL/FixJ family response regulator|nr:LuxR C-terminal-related transcriptional regulator [Bacteroidales bacterium]
MSKHVKIIIAEHSPVIATGIKALLAENTYFEVVAVVATFEQLQEKMIRYKNCVLIINPHFMEYSKQQMIKSVFQDCENWMVVALLTSYVEQNLLKQYHGFIELADTGQRIESKLREIVHNPEMNEHKKDNFELSDREKVVLVAVAKGMINKEIAHNLNISVHTVVSHRKNITRKTGIKSVSGLTVYALLNNLIDSNEVI